MTSHVSGISTTGLSKGHGDGTAVSNTNTHVGGASVDIVSGGDTTLKGAVVTGNQVTATIGGNLAVQSVQDTTTYNAKQQSAGASISLCIPPICYGACTGSASSSDAKVTGNFASVTEQSGFKAGDGGFQVAVNGSTTLTGGVISASQAAIDVTFGCGCGRQWRGRPLTGLERQLSGSGIRESYLADGSGPDENGAAAAVVREPEQLAVRSNRLTGDAAVRFAGRPWTERQ